jgi:hypothetical protein
MKNLGQFGQEARDTQMQVSYNNDTGSIEVDDKMFNQHAENLRSHIVPEHMREVGGLIEKQRNKLRWLLGHLRSEILFLKDSTSEETKFWANSLLEDFEVIISQPIINIKHFQQALNEKRNGLQSDLSIWDCFVNFLKRIANALLSILPGSDRNRFFQQTTTPVLQSFENFVIMV